MKKTVILLFVASLFMYACNTTKSLETEVTIAIDSDFDVLVENCDCFSCLLKSSTNHYCNDTNLSNQMCFCK